MIITYICGVYLLSDMYKLITNKNISINDFTNIDIKHGKVCIHRVYAINEYIYLLINFLIYDTIILQATDI